MRSGRWFTVGEDGASFEKIKKGDIIFNHLQTKQLLENGYVTGRGKLHGGSAFASGTAFAGGGGSFASYDFSGSGGYAKYDVNGELVDSFGDLSGAASDIADAADEFREVFDWVEVRLEEIEETLGLLESQLENAVHYTSKNTIIDDMIDANNIKLDNLKAGYQEYVNYANALLTEIPEKYREAAQNGAIAIEEFVGEADEVTLEAINNYREWAQKAADLKQQANEVMATIRDLAIQKFDNAYEHGDVRATVEDSQTEKLQNAVDYDEERGLITSDAYYIAMMENSNMKIKYLTNAREAMQKELDAAVEAGQIVRGSNEWYELIDQMYQIDAAIDEATIELEQFQNAINDLYWDNFEQLINRLDYLKNETQSLIDLMDNEDLVDESGNWTDEGLASLGLHAQQMEIAEYQARQYAEAIDDLTADYEAGLYSEDEYMEKLDELKNAQYENIEAYEEAKQAIVDLNKTRVDAIKEGLQEEIESYEKLIETKKKALDAEKDLYDFQKSTAEQAKNISDLERQLAALSLDNSASARAKKAQLEAELYEARAALEEAYYNRSVEDKQNALDQELESFRTEKEAEITAWEEYLTNIEIVVAESLGIVQENASGIYDTLMAKAEEYDLTISEAIMTPWQDGTFAVSNYQTQFDTAISSTMEQLEALKAKWQEVIDKMVEAGNTNVNAIHDENHGYTTAEKQPEQTQPSTPSNPPSNNSSAESQYTTYTVKSGDSLSAIAKKQLGSASRWQEIYNLNKDIISNPNVIYPGQKLKLPKYAKGTLGIKKDELAWIDEMGLEELVLHAGPDGRLQYLTKGTSVIPSAISENLMQLGQLDPSAILDRNRPQIGVSPSVVNNTMEINMNISEIVHIDSVSSETIPDLTKAVRKEMDSYMVKLNNAIKAKVR